MFANSGYIRAKTSVCEGLAAGFFFFFLEFTTSFASCFSPSCTQIPARHVMSVMLLYSTLRMTTRSAGLASSLALPYIVCINRIEMMSISFVKNRVNGSTRLEIARMD